MATSQADIKDRQFLAVIGDEVWIILIERMEADLEAGFGHWAAPSRHRSMFPEPPSNLVDHLQHVTAPPDSQKNFLVVDGKTDTSAIESAFDRFTTERKDIGIVLINQHVGGHR